MEVILILLFEIVCGNVLNSHSAPNDEYSLVCIIVTSIVLFIFIFRKIKNYEIIFFIAYILRLAILFADYFHWFPVLHSGGDTEMFHRISLDIMDKSLYNDEVLIVTNYPYFTGAIYLLIGPQRLFVQYINVLFGMWTLYYIYKSLSLLRLKRKTIKLFLYVGCLFPHLIILSGILLREAIVEFSVAASVYFFLKWFLKNKKMDFIVSLCFVLLGSLMHSGVFLLFIGYLMALLFYNHRTNKISFSFSSILYGLFSILIVVLIIVQTDVFTEKFNKLEDVDSFEEYEVLADQKAGSTYLTWLDVKGTEQILLYSPLKMFYFLFSPIPFDWRSASDVIAFLLDSVVYFILVLGIFRKYKNLNGRRERRLILFLIISLLCTIFIFSYGTSVSGTALRHRAKILPLLMVITAICYDRKRKKLSSSFL